MGSNRFKAFDWIRTSVREHAESLALALILALMVRFFVLAAYVVRSDSMSPTLLGGDIVLGFKPPFGILGTEGREPVRGELVIFNCPGGTSLCLRRVIALGGDRIEMRKQRLAVNGEDCRYTPTSEKLVLSESCGGLNRPISISADWETENRAASIVPPQHVFVMNDHRPNRDDSRTWGAIPYSDLQSTAVGVWLSFDWSASNGWPQVRWGRTFLRVN
jgi:signal peptidase I